MSHAVVWVITEGKPTEENIFEQMLPYHEYESTGYEEYTVLEDITDEIKDGWNNLSEEKKLHYHNDSDNYFDTYYNGTLVKQDDGEIRYYRRTNPNSKWDWYTVGGRFSNYINEDMLTDECIAELAKAEYHSNSYKKGHITWCKEIDEIDKFFTEFSLEVERLYKDNKIANKTEILTSDMRYDIRDECNKIYNDYHKYPYYSFIDVSEVLDMCEHGITDFSKWVESKHILVYPFAILHNKEWHESGSLGWFGCVSDKKSSYDWGNEFLSIWDSIPDDYWVTVVDYHI